jgi:DNA/RNA-binding domain of Phe-tRNA-synthetase-like protein
MHLPVKLALISLQGIQVTKELNAFEQLLNQAENYYKKYHDFKISNVYGIQEARTLFRNIGIDPTKHRPSSEALLRRALKKKQFFSVNNLVDAGNWCSLDFLLPICVYDADKIQGEITIGLGKENETYFAHNNREINLHNRFIISDDLGAFGSPITDSVRTAVTLSTRNSLLVIFAPDSISDNLLQDHVSSLCERVFEFCGGNFKEINYYPGKLCIS